MAEFVRDTPSARFSVPDAITVKQQLRYMSAAVTAKLDFERYWAGALVLMQDWSCDLIKDPHKLDLEKETDPRVTDVVIWAGWQVKQHVDQLGTLPKN